jgi:hypothetical protein
VKYDALMRSDSRARRCSTWRRSRASTTGVDQERRARAPTLRRVAPEAQASSIAMHVGRHLVEPAACAQ